MCVSKQCRLILEHRKHCRILGASTNSKGPAKCHKQRSFVINTLDAFELWLLLHIESSWNMSLCHYYFVLFARRTFHCEHTTPGFDPHTAAAVSVCMRKNCIEYYDEGKIFLFNLFSSFLSLLFAEKPKSERKSWFFLHNTKTFRFNFAFPSKHNPFLSCFQTHFPNPVRKTFFCHWLSPLARGTQKENSFTALNMDRGESVRRWTEPSENS